MGAIVSERLQNQFGNAGVLDALLGGEALGEMAAPVVAELGWATSQSGPLEGSFSSNSAMLKEWRKAQGGQPAMPEIPMSGGQKLSQEQIARFNAAFRYNFSHVVIHADAAAGRAAAAFHARAFTIGSHIWMGEGEYQPGSPATNELLAHELTHVIQSDKGRIPANVEGVSSPSDPLEQEAYAAEAPMASELRGVDARVRAGGWDALMMQMAGTSDLSDEDAVADAEVAAPQGAAEAPRQMAEPVADEPSKKMLPLGDSPASVLGEPLPVALESAPHLSAKEEGKRDAQSYFAEVARVVERVPPKDLDRHVETMLELARHELEGPVLAAVLVSKVSFILKNLPDRFSAERESLRQWGEELLGAKGGTEPVEREVLRKEEDGASKAEPGSGYSMGNRPDPSFSSNAIYDIKSNAPRVLRVGEAATYRVVQKQDAIQAPESVVGLRWRVRSDAKSGNPDWQVPMNVWQAVFKPTLSGTYEILVEMTLNGVLMAELRYTQLVVENERVFAEIGEVPASSLATMGDFVALVERIEKAYPGLAWQDVTTKIRNEFYSGIPGSSLWDPLIAPFTWDDNIDEQEGMPPLQSPPVAAADIAALRKGPMIEGVDIGHILTGVDSMNFPKVAGVFSAFDMDGPAAATWAGDVGSALVRWSFPLSDKHGPKDESTRERYYGMFASPGDLLGDVDGLALAALPELSPTAPLSQRLRAYYLDSADTGVKRRWHHFCEVSGFEVHEGKISAESRAYIREQVLSFARGFYVAKGGMMADVLMDVRYTVEEAPDEMNGKYVVTSGSHESVQLMVDQPSHQRIRENLDWFVDRFVQDVELGLETEE